VNYSLHRREMTSARAATFGRARGLPRPRQVLTDRLVRAIFAPIMMLTSRQTSFDANATRPMYGCALPRVYDAMPAGLDP